MSIWCKLGRHEAGPRIASNGGTYFGWCSHCEAELVLSPRGWSAVPKGYRIVWRRRNAETCFPCEEQLELALDPKAAEKERGPAKRKAKRIARRLGAEPPRRRASDRGFGKAARVAATA